MKCPTCESTQLSKNGRHCGKQRYICKHCGRQFLESYLAKGYPEAVKRQCLELYVNGMGFRAIERVTGIHHTTVGLWVKQAGTTLPKAPESKDICSTPQKEFQRKQPVLADSRGL